MAQYGVVKPYAVFDISRTIVVEQSSPTSLFTKRRKDNSSQPVGETMNPYCVVLCPELLGNPVSCPRTKRFFLRATLADGAIQAALADNPQWRVIGVEPRDLFARLLQAPSCPIPHDWYAA
jgi:hypothetical protein